MKSRIDLKKIRERIHQNVTTRFAPAPTGHIHLGHIVNAIFVFGIARVLDGTILLRMEDHDRNRSREEYARSIQFDMEWLGFLNGNETWTIQSQRTGLYEDYLNELTCKYHIYACDCSRKRLEERGGIPLEGEVCYDGFCRNRGLEPGEGKSLRIRIPDNRITFNDLACGMQTQLPLQQCGDLTLKDNKGNWTYQYAVVVDDLDQGVNLIIRGEDLLSSTGRQILLRKMATDRPHPVYLHHPLLFGSDGVKLSKKDNSYSIKEMREEGISPDTILGRAAFLSGLLDEEKGVRVEDIPDLFI